MGISKFLGNSLIKRLENIEFSSVDEIRKRLYPDTSIGEGKWVDIAGLFAPEQIIFDFVTKVEVGEFKTLNEIDTYLKDVHQSYYQYAWTWVIQVIQQRLGKTIEQFTVADIVDIVKRWKLSVVELDKMLIDDAAKEFSPVAIISFGLDGDNETRKKDFEHVRGIFETDTFVLEIKEHIKKKSILADNVLERLSKVKN